MTMESLNVLANRWLTHTTAAAATDQEDPKLHRAGQGDSPAAGDDEVARQEEGLQVRGQVGKYFPLQLGRQQSYGAVHRNAHIEV